VDEHFVDALREKVPQDDVLLAAGRRRRRSYRPLLGNVQNVADQEQTVVDAVALLQTQFFFLESRSKIFNTSWKNLTNFLAYVFRLNPEYIFISF